MKTETLKIKANLKFYRKLQNNTGLRNLLTLITWSHFWSLMLCCLGNSNISCQGSKRFLDRRSHKVEQTTLLVKNQHASTQNNTHPQSSRGVVRQ